MEKSSYAVVKLPQKAYDIVKQSMIKGGISHQIFKDGTLEMSGLAFRPEESIHELPERDVTSLIRSTLENLAYPKDVMLQAYLQRITPRPERFIAGVAVVFEDIIYRLFPPNRHADVIRLALLQTKRALFVGGEQGFFDNHGVFLTREVAWEIAFAAGQIIDPEGPTAGVLYSEDLYTNHKV